MFWNKNRHFHEKFMHFQSEANVYHRSTIDPQCRAKIQPQQINYIYIKCVSHRSFSPIRTLIFGLSISNVHSRHFSFLTPSPLRCQFSPTLYHVASFLFRTPYQFYLACTATSMAHLICNAQFWVSNAESILVHIFAAFSGHGWCEMTMSTSIYNNTS